MKKPPPKDIKIQTENYNVKFIVTITYISLMC